MHKFNSKKVLKSIQCKKNIPLIEQANRDEGMEHTRKVDGKQELPVENPEPGEDGAQLRDARTPEEKKRTKVLPMEENMSFIIQTQNQNLIKNKKQILFMNKQYNGKLDQNYTTIRNQHNMRTQFQPKRLYSLERKNQAEMAKYETGRQIISVGFSSFRKEHNMGRTQRVGGLKEPKMRMTVER